MKSGRKDHQNRLLRAGESQDIEGDAVIHSMNEITNIQMYAILSK